MAFHQGHVVAIVDSNNKPLREFYENNQKVVRMPFGQEYKIRLKNKNSKRCYVEVEIDGMRIDSQNRRLVLGPDQEIDIERFIDDLDKGKRFKFVSAESAECQDPTSKDNGKVRVTFYPEYVLQWATHTYYTNTPFWTSQAGVKYGNINLNMPWNSGLVEGSISCTSASTSGFATSAISASNAIGTAGSATDLGATAAGSDSSQSFGTSYESFLTEVPVSFEIQLRGPKAKTEKPFRVYVNGRDVTDGAHLTPDGKFIVLPEAIQLQAD